MAIPWEDCHVVLWVGPRVYVVNLTMGDLAVGFDISNQAASERLRRGLSNSLRNGVLDDPNVR